MRPAAVRAKSIRGEKKLITTMDNIGCSDLASVTYNDFRRLRAGWGTELEVRLVPAPWSRSRQLTCKSVEGVARGPRRAHRPSLSN